MKMMMTYRGNGVAPPLVGGGANSNSGSGMEGGGDRGLSRMFVVNVWNAQAAKRTWNNVPMATTPFRAVNNAGDYLSRQNYTSGGSNQLYGRVNSAVTPTALVLGGGIFSKLDGTGIPSCTANVKYVYDGSDYTRFKKMQATNRTYNDYSFGGANNGSQTAIARARM
jgi:hypothetical protein